MFLNAPLSGGIIFNYLLVNMLFVIKMTYTTDISEERYSLFFKEQEERKRSGGLDILLGGEKDGHSI